MRISLQRKILLVFALLISFSLVQGFLLYSALHSFRAYNQDMHRVREFQFIIHILESSKIYEQESTADAAALFDKEYRRGKELLGQMADLASRLASNERKHLLEADDYLDNYRQAFAELTAHDDKASALHRQALAIYGAMATDLAALPAESAAPLFPLLLQLSSLEDEIRDHYDVTLIPKLKRQISQISVLSGNQGLSVPAHDLVTIAEQGYLNSLARAERAVFLQQTAEHFFTFTDDILAFLDQQIERLQQRLIVLISGILASAVVFGLLLYLGTNRYFRAFLNHQRTAIMAVEEGRYDYPLPANLPGDELGDLVRFTKDMAVTLQQHTEAIRISENTVRESEAQVRLILNSAAEAIYGLDSDGRCTFCNQSMLAILGYEREEELLGRNMHDIIHHHRLDGTPYPWDQCLAHHSFLLGRESHSAEEYLFRRDGSSFPAECWSHPIRDRETITGAVITFIDITQRKAAEQALRTSEHLYRTLVEQIDLGVTLIDKNHTIIMTNTAQGRIFGKDPANFRGGKCFREFEKKEAVCNHCPGVIAMTTRMPHEIFAQGIRDDGTTTSARVRAFPVFAADDSVTGFIEVVEDMSQKIQAERNLAEEKERLAVTLRSIGDGVIATDTAGLVVLINKVAEDLCGWPAAEAAGRPLGEVFRIVHEKTGELCANPVDKVLATGMTVSLANHTVLIARDGTRRSIADSGAPIRDRESNIIGVVLVFRDVTEHQRMEVELLKSKKLESIGVLAGGIAHDFNNILAAILGNINLVRHIIAPTEKRAHTFLEEAEKASLRAQNLTQQLLTFSRGGEPVRKAASLIEIIKDSTAFVLRGTGIKSEYDLAADLWPVNVDPGQISQVVQNIVLNARHAMPRGGTVRVRCRNLRSGEELPPMLGKNQRYVMVDIADNGIGIPANLIDNIFDPYFSTKKEGSGLGLAICHSIVSKHQGHIRVNSEPGKGTVFTFFLPAADADSALEERPHIEHREQTLAPLGISVLVMDDDEQVRHIAAAMLSHLGCTVLEAEDGEKAIALYRAGMEKGEAIGAVIMDLTIPGGMGGKEAVTELLRIDPAARVIVSSGYSTDPIMANYRKFGFCGAIVKPYQLKEIAQVLTDTVAPAQVGQRT